MGGEPLWSRDFGKMNVRHGFGEGSSPTLAGDLIIVPWDHEGPSLLFALDKRTSKTVWETPRDEPTGWATPLVVNDVGEGVDATPAPAGDSLFVRGERHLFRFARE